MLTYRYDYFLVWGHGIKYISEITDSIRNHPALKIVKILKHFPETVDQLVYAVYSFDYAPLEHLRGKTEYLKQTPNEVYFIFVENRFPDEDYFGEGPYRHLESYTMKALKEQIRNRFNPRVDGRRSEDHVIHASDNQLQSDHILRYLGFAGVDLFRKKHLALDAPYHLPEITDFSIRKIPLSSLQCRIVAGDRRLYAPERVDAIDKTPHYRALAGDPGAYLAYLENFMGLALTDDHCLRNFMSLKDSFRYLAGPFASSYIIVEETEPDVFVVLDGVHRAALLRHQGVTDLHVAVIDAGCENA